MMATARLFDALPDFAPRQRQMQPGHEPAQTSLAPRADHGEHLRQGVLRAEAALRETLAAQHQAELAGLKETHAAELAEQMRLVGGGAAEMIAQRFAELDAAVTGGVSASVARIVGGVLSEELRNRSIDGLARTIRSALRDREAVRLSITGPQSLHEALVAALPADAVQIEFHDGPGFDLTVALDGALFETRLGEWSSTLGEILS